MLQNRVYESDRDNFQISRLEFNVPSRHVALNFSNFWFRCWCTSSTKFRAQKMCTGHKSEIWTFLPNTHVQNVELLRTTLVIWFFKIHEYFGLITAVICKIQSFASVADVQILVLSLGMIFPLHNLARCTWSILHDNVIRF